MEEYINIAKLDCKKYASLIKDDLISDEVIITYKQIEHINEKDLEYMINTKIN